MKSFKDIVKETVNPPKSPDEKRFLDKHVVNKMDHPVAKDDQFVAKTKKDKSKVAGYHDGKDKEVYEAADVHTKRADKKAVIVHDVDPKTGQSKTTTRQARTGEVKVEEVEIIEKSMSQAQAIAARIALAVKRGKLPKSKLQGASKEMIKMSEKDLEDFTKAKKGAPYKVSESTNLREKAYVSSMSPELGRKGSHDVIGKDGKVVKSYPYTKDGMKAAQAHLSKMKEEVELDEAAPKVKPDFIKTQREKDRAHDAAMGRTPTGRKKPVRQMTSTQRSLASMRNEEVELDEDISKMSHSRLKFHMNTGVPHGSYSNAEMKAERDRRLKTGEGEAYKKAKASMSEDFDQLDEIGDTAAGKKKLKNLIVNRTQKVADAGASLERRPEKAAEYDRAQKRHMKTIGRAATRLAKEEVELDEAFKAGSMKLKDGSTVQLDKENAKAVNALFNELNPSNKKKMEAKMMESKQGFSEIIKFAKEAL